MASMMRPAAEKSLSTQVEVEGGVRYLGETNEIYSQGKQDKEEEQTQSNKSRLNRKNQILKL